MGSKREKNWTNTNRSSVVEYITVYKYGKMYSPVVYKTTKCKQRTEPGSRSVDRPGLISKIHRLLAIHRSFRSSRREGTDRTTCDEKGIHNALFKVIRFCFEQKICLSKLYPVGDLFLELFLCSGNTYALFSILVKHVSLTSQLMNTNVNILYPYHMADVNKDALEYYLQHTMSAGCKNERNKIDILNNEIDQISGTTPLTAALHTRDPSLVLILLRYGADPFFSPVTSSMEDRKQNPLEQLIDDLNGLFLFKNTGFSDATRAKLAAEESKAWKILSYFRRAVPGIPLTSTNHIVTTLPEEESNCTEYLDDRCLAKQMYGIHPGIAESINAEYFKATVSLKHLCRCAIRGHLRVNNGNLPEAINLLPLPTKMKNYVDLLLD